MHIQIVNKGIDVSPAIRERISDRIEDMMDKYIHRDGEGVVAISKEGSGFKVVCDMHLPSGVSMQGQSEAQDAYSAADEALDHLEKRLRRYKRKLKDHHRDAKAEAMAMFILENPLGDEDDDSDDEGGAIAEPIVIAEKSAKLRKMTVSMASLELGLSDSGVVVFRNTQNGHVNVVFKRPDGNIGWINPEQ